MARRWTPTTVAVAAAVLTACAGGPAGGEREERSPWIVRAPIEGATLELGVFAGNSSCVTFDRVEVDERPDVVRVDAYVRVDDGQPCTDDFVVEPVTVTLDAPFGERALEGCADEDLGFAAFGREGPIDCAEPVEGW